MRKITLVERGADIATTIRNLNLEIMNGTIDGYMKFLNALASAVTLQGEQLSSEDGTKFVVPESQLAFLLTVVRMMTSGKITVGLAFNMFEVVQQQIKFRAFFEVFSIGFAQKRQTETLESGEINISENYSALVNIDPDQASELLAGMRDPAQADQFTQLIQFMSNFLLRSRETPVGQLPDLLGELDNIVPSGTSETPGPGLNPTAPVPPVTQ